jgi:P4 family phage/plasmid primase-like protien
MEKAIKNYKYDDYIIFSVQIEQEEKNEKWKKKLIMPKGWQNFTKDNMYINKEYNGLAMITGKVNNIVVIDIDSVEDWNKLLEENNEEEPETVKAKSGSGGIHLYFKYSDELEKIKSTSKCFGNEYDIDVRSNGGCIILPPSKYYNKNEEKEVKYKWIESIFETELVELPEWMKNLLLPKKEEKIKTEEITEIENQEEEEIKKMTDAEIDKFSELLSVKRADNYNSWIEVGMCLKNISSDYKYIWKKFSEKSDKYSEKECDEKWKSFKKNKDGLKIGSLLKWCKEDNEKEYDEYMKKRKLNKLIEIKYPKEKLILDKEIKDGPETVINLKNNGCLIKGGIHDDMSNSMYLRILDKYMTVKCRHPECHGRSYCNHTLSRNEMISIGTVNITINEQFDKELVEFQEFKLFDDEELNELVYNGLTGKPAQMAEIIYYLYPKKYNYGEDNSWYIYENHKWKNMGIKNLNLRSQIQSELKKIYKDVINYYKENNVDSKKIMLLKNIISSFGETTLKNNIMTELLELYSEKNNKNGDFVKKMDSNNKLIGFENGVYDLDKMEFREGKIDDLISMSTGYEYKDKYSDKYQELTKFLEDIQPNEKEREYMLTYLSIGLVGNLLELFTILTGSGRNGKSKLIELLKLTLGDYGGSVPSQLFTRVRPDANAPDPGLLSLAKKRVVISSEPEKNSKLNSGFIKFITGRDSTTLRNCHSNDMVDFTAKFMTLFVCNDIPECDDIDNAFSKRLRCINFPTEFVDIPIKENQKKINVNINNNFENWRSDFMLLLIDYYKKYKETHILTTTDDILMWTNKYKEETDLYLQFLNDTIELTNNDDDKMHISDMYGKFKIWHKENNPQSKIPSNKEFVLNLKKHNNVIGEIKPTRIENKSNMGIRRYKFIE